MHFKKLRLLLLPPVLLISSFPLILAQNDFNSQPPKSASTPPKNDLPVSPKSINYAEPQTLTKNNDEAALVKVVPGNQGADASPMYVVPGNQGTEPQGADASPVYVPGKTASGARNNHPKSLDINSINRGIESNMPANPAPSEEPKKQRNEPSGPPTDPNGIYSPNNMATAIILTFVFTVLALAAFYWWWNRRRALMNKERHLILETDPEKGGKTEYAFDNPGFKDATLIASEKSPKLDSKHKWTPWSPLSALTLTRLDKKRAADDSQIEQSHEVKVVALKSYDFTGLGFSICGNMKDGIYIKDILHRGPAFESGKLNIGDRINSVTISFEHMVYEDALTILSYASPYEVMIEAKSGRIQTSYGQQSGNPNHPVYRSSSYSDLYNMEKSSKKKLFTDDYSSGSNYSSLQKSRSNMTTLERKESKSPRSNMPKSKKQDRSPTKLTPDLLKTHFEEKVTIENSKIKENVQKFENELQKTTPHQKFGIRVLPSAESLDRSPKITEQNENNFNIEKIGEDTPRKLSIDEVDKKITPPQPRKREKKSPETGNFERNDSNIKRDKNGIPMEVPEYMMGAAVAAKRNRKSQLEGSTNEEEISKKATKARAPHPPAEKFDDTQSVGESRSLHSQESEDSHSLDHAKDRDRAKFLISDSEDERTLSSVNTIELNSSDVTVLQTEDEASRAGRKTASTGDLSKMNKKVTNTTGTLERAQSLDNKEPNTNNSNLVKKHIFDETENLLIDREPRLSLILDGLNTFQRNRLKKSTEWNHLEDAILNLSQENGEWEHRRKSEPHFNAVMDRVKQIKRDSHEIEIPDSVVMRYHENGIDTSENVMPKIKNQIWPTEINDEIEPKWKKFPKKDESPKKGQPVAQQRNSLKNNLEKLEDSIAKSLENDIETFSTRKYDLSPKKEEKPTKKFFDSSAPVKYSNLTKKDMEITKKSFEKDIQSFANGKLDVSPKKEEKIAKFNVKSKAAMFDNKADEEIRPIGGLKRANPLMALNLDSEEEISTTTKTPFTLNFKSCEPDENQTKVESDLLMEYYKDGIFPPNVSEAEMLAKPEIPLRTIPVKNISPECQKNMIKDEWELVEEHSLNNVSPPLSLTLVDEVMDTFNKNRVIEDNYIPEAVSNLPDENKYIPETKSATENFLSNEILHYETTTNISDDIKVSRNSLDSIDIKKSDIEAKQPLKRLDSPSKVPELSQKFNFSPKPFEKPSEIHFDFKPKIVNKETKESHIFKPKIAHVEPKSDDAKVDHLIVSQVTVTENGASNLHSLELSINEPSELYTTALEKSVTDVVVASKTAEKSNLEAKESEVGIVENSFSKVCEKKKSSNGDEFDVDIVETKYSRLDVENPIFNGKRDESPIRISQKTTVEVEDNTLKSECLDAKAKEDEASKTSFVTEIQVVNTNNDDIGSNISEIEVVSNGDHLENAFENYVNNFEAKLDNFESNMQNFENKLEEFVRDEPKSLILEDEKDIEMQVSKIQQIAEEQLKTLPEMRFTTSSYESQGRKTPEKRHSFEILRSNFEKTGEKSPPKTQGTPPRSRIPISTTMKTPPMSPERRDSRNLENENDRAILELMSSSVHSTPFTSKIKPPTPPRSLSEIEFTSKIKPPTPTKNLSDIEFVSKLRSPSTSTKNLSEIEFTSRIKPPSTPTKNVTVTSIRNNSKIPSGLPTLSGRPPIAPRKSEGDLSSNGGDNFKQWVFNPANNVTNVSVGKDK